YLSTKGPHGAGPPSLAPGAVPAETDGYVLDAGDVIGAHAHDRPRRRDLRVPPEQLLEQHARLELRKARSEAEVGAEAEREVIVWRPGHVETIGPLEHGLVTVRRHVPHHHPVSRTNPPSGQLHVALGRSPEVHHRS